MDLHGKISAFLYYGYLPEFKDTHIAEVFPDIESPEQLCGLDLDSRNESEIIHLGVTALRNTFAYCLEKNPSERHILLLSGGLDSRAILACLLELGVKERLETVTFGVSGSWDYEIASCMAGNFNIAHTSIDLTKIELSTEALYQTAKNGCAWTFLFDGFYNQLIPRKFGAEVVYWSGYMGDLVAGNSLRPVLYEGFDSWEDAVSYYSRRLKAGFFHIIELFPPGFDPASVLPAKPWFEEKRMNYFDQLCIIDTHENYLKRAIIPPGYCYVTPFCHKDWVNFILFAPLHLRMNKYVYKKILFSAYPDLFSYPVKEFWGASLKSSPTEVFFRHAVQWIKNRTGFADHLWRRLGVYRVMQYIDFNVAVRQRDDYRELVRENIADLKNRNLIDWLDLDTLWADHQNKSGDFGVELLLLTALEISLKVEDEESLNN
jgi:hypothetical protein